VPQGEAALSKIQASELDNSVRKHQQRRSSGHSSVPEDHGNERGRRSSSCLESSLYGWRLPDSEFLLRRKRRHIHPMVAACAGHSDADPGLPRGFPKKTCGNADNHHGWPPNNGVPPAASHRSAEIRGAGPNQPRVRHTPFPSATKQPPISLQVGGSSIPSDSRAVHPSLGWNTR
jgi:hypothetical protein